MQDPFRKGIGHAVQWYNLLRRQVVQRVEKALLFAEEVPAEIRQRRSDGVNLSPNDAQEQHPNNSQERPLPLPSLTSPSEGPLPFYPSSSTPSSTPSPGPVNHSAICAGEQAPSSPSPPLTECARILQQRCPSCFAGTKFGHSLEK